MTDNEIIKALELEATPMERNCIHAKYEEACGIWCTKKHKIAENCMECKEHAMGYYGRYAKATLDLINRLKAEIEMLKGWERLLKAESHALIIKKSKAEAVKEFAELVKENQKLLFNSIYSTINFDIQIDRLVKETVGEKND